MPQTKKATALNASIGVDARQSPIKTTKTIITDIRDQNNSQATSNSVDNIVNCPVQTGQYKLNTLSMDELYDHIYPPKVPIVDGLIYSGTYLFVGAPKVGKSFFMAQLGFHVSKGLPLWGYEVKKGTVLYLALEDDYARLQKRLSTMFGEDSSDNLFFTTQSMSLNFGLEEQLASFVKEHKDARLIIIDTLQKVREVGGDRFSYASDYEIVTKLKRFSDENNICLLVVHHTRKMEASDSFDMISGTNGLLGAADGAFIMQKEKRTENKAILEVAGRDQQEQRLEIEFNRERCSWELTKAETELWKEIPDPILEEIALVVTEESPEWKGTASELLLKLPKVETAPNMLTRKLNINAGTLLMKYNIKYESVREHEGRMIELNYVKKE